ncbi:MAG TPA: hypothetical protein VF138_11165 [Caulobacteraceae bacterium]
MDKVNEESVTLGEEQAQDEWVKPAVTSFAPVRAAEGISYLPTDGISNLTP